MNKISIYDFLKLQPLLPKNVDDEYINQRMKLPIRYQIMDIYGEVTSLLKFYDDKSKNIQNKEMSLTDCLKKIDLLCCYIYYNPIHTD